MKLLSNRVYAVSQEDGLVLLSVLQKGAAAEENRALIEKYGLLNDGRDEEERRRRRWDNLFAQRKIYSLELMMAQECNLRCDYCYGDANFGGSGMMRWETAKRAMDWLMQAMKGREYPRGSEVLVSFIGGEPLLNFPVIEKAIRYIWDECGQRGILFSVTTNLTLLNDEMLEFMQRYPMGMCISFDGRMQHRYRRFANGGDSYDRVVENIRKVLAVMPDASGRATLYGEGNMDDMADDLREAGFTRGYINAASGSLISGTVLENKRDAYRAMTQTYPELTRRYLEAIRNRDEKTYRRISFDSEFMQAIGLGWNPPVQMMSCGCGRTMYAVDVQGNLYPCHRFVGVEKMKVGTLDTPFEELPPGDFADHITFVHEGCKECFLRYFCGGSCMHENYCDASASREKPSVHVPFEEFCAYRRTAAQLAIHVEHSLSAQDKAWLREIEHGMKE